MPKVSAEHKAAVRERLLEAAEACLLDRGVEGFTTRDVLERAGLSAGTLYNYFSGKDDLLLGMAERRASADLPGLADVGDLLDVTRRLLTDPADGLMPELRNRARLDPHVRNALTRYDQLVVGTFAPRVEREQAEGRLDAAIDAAALVELVELVFEALSAHAAAGTFVTSRERVAATFLSLLGDLQGART